MSKAQLDSVLQQLDELVKAGGRIVQIASNADTELPGNTLAEVMTWVTRAGNLIRRLGGAGSAYDQLYHEALKEKEFNFIHSNHCGHIAQIQGALAGLQHDARTGLLVEIRRLLQAEIFADFLEMAEHLLQEGYKDAAAVILGGVLEDALRKLAESRGLELLNANGRRLTIEPLNVSLAKANVYQPLTQKQITSWADIRNNAAHGDHGKYSADDVKQMLLFVQKFCADHLQ